VPPYVVVLLVGSAAALAYFSARGRPRAFASTAVLSGCAAFVLVTVTILGFGLK
jgi:hypothetical protein